MRANASAAERHWLDAERIRVYAWMTVAIFVVGYAIWILLSLPDLVDPAGKPIGNDFLQFWGAARLALDGRPAAAFDWPTLIAVQHAAVPAKPYFLTPWFYPPTFLLVVVPFGLLPYPAALVAFLAATVALWGALVRRLLPDRRAWIVAAATPAALVTILSGQNALLTASFAGLALLSLDRRPVVAGVLIGLLAVKPHLAALFPIALAAEGRWRSFAAAAVTALAMVAASLAAFGWGTFVAFFAHLPELRRIVETPAASWGHIPSAYVFGLSLRLPVAAAYALQVATALFAALCVWRVWRNRDAAFEAKAATLLAGSLLVSPYLSYYDLTWAAVAIGWLVVLGRRTGFRRGEREIFLFAWLAPLLMPPVYALISLQPVGFSAVLLLLVAARRRAGGEAVAAVQTVVG